MAFEWIRLRNDPGVVLAATPTLPYVVSRAYASGWAWQANRVQVGSIAKERLPEPPAASSLYRHLWQCQ